MVVGAIVFGLGIDYLFPESYFTVSGIATAGAHCAHCLGAWDWFWIALLALLLVNAFVRMFWHPHHGGNVHHEAQCSDSHGAETAAEASIERDYKVDGMSCNHCKASVEKAIIAVEGVEYVEVSLTRGIAHVQGSHDPEAIIKAVSDIGFKANVL